MAELSCEDLATFSSDARIYLQPACFVDRPHGLDGRVARIADTMVWHAAWQLACRMPGQPAREALVPVDTMAAWLAAMPAPLAASAAAQISACAAARPPLALKGRTIRFGEPQVMGIVNVTPDSFSDGGRFIDPERAAAHGAALASAGASIVDVGGESTRPGAPLVWEGEESERIVPVIERLARAGIAVSVDTRKASVMEAGLAAGAAMINDVSALGYDDRALDVVARSCAPVVLMHAPSQSSDPHKGDKYLDILYDVYDFLDAAIARAVAGGIARERIIADPGIGFGKGVQDNLRLMNGMALFHSLGVPLLVGTSRKRLIGALDNEAPADMRLGGSIALLIQAANAGVQLHRVHDVAEARQALRVWRGARDTALTRPWH